MMNLSDAIKLFYQGEVTYDTIRLVLNTVMNDIVDAVLYDGISFCWSFDDIDSDDLDTCIYEHEGQEIII